MTQILSITTIIVLSTTMILLLLSAITFYKENEKRASIVSLIIGIITFAILFLIIVLNNSILNNSILIFATALIVVVTIPFKGKIKDIPGVVLKQFDERDVMFSRAELKEGSQRFEEYYKANPKNKEADDKFRIKAGLLSNKAIKYHKFKFASADANFITVNNFVQNIDENKLTKKQEIDANEISIYINKWLKQIGAINVGITELKSHHLYSNKGRGDKYGNKVVNNHKYAIAFTVEMDKDMLDTAPNAEAIMESSQQYLEAAKIASQLTNFIRNLGYSAKPHIDGNYDLICPVVAKDAGLGEFGRMGLLMTPELGPRVRIAVVTTDIPLIINQYKYNPSIVDFCTICKKCADNCPTDAISFDNMKEEDGVMRWKINHEVCFTYWNITGTDCAKCIQVCPYSHPDNAMHNIVRKGINNSYVFGEMALKMDDLFYGRKPGAKDGKLENY